MTGVYSILGFVAKLKAIEHDTKEVGHAIVARACEMVCAEAKRVIGVGYPEWPALKPETLAKKMGAGPLLETGELRASIEWQSHGNEGAVGSNNDKAVWHELGKRIIDNFLALFPSASARHDGGRCRLYCCRDSETPPRDRGRRRDAARFKLRMTTMGYSSCARPAGSLPRMPRHIAIHTPAGQAAGRMAAQNGGERSDKQESDI